MSVQEYNEKVDQVSRQAPDHPLLPVLLNGHSRINVIYLRKALDSLPREKKGDPSDKLKLLYIRKSSLFGQRARLSNQMCALPEGTKFDKARADLIDQIQPLQKQIEDVFGQIEALEKGRQVPTIEADPGLPADKADLLKKRLSLRSAISRAKKKAQSEKKATRDTALASLIKLEKQLADVEVALANC